MSSDSLLKFEVGKEVEIDPEEFFGIKIVECDPTTAIIERIDVKTGVITLISKPRETDKNECKK